jgi:hypothetical protein
MVGRDGVWRAGTALGCDRAQKAIARMGRTAAPAHLSRHPTVSQMWRQAGFGRQEAEAWRDAGWSDAGLAADWMAASPGDSPHLLHSLHDAGYSAEQLRQTRRTTRSHVAAWMAALLPPEHGGPSIARDRAAVARRLLTELSTDDEGNTVIDLR